MTIGLFRSSAAGMAAALLLSVSACNESPAAPLEDDEPQLTVVSGNNQVGVVGRMLSSPLTVRVGTRTAPVEGALVNFVVVRGGGRTWAGSALTDSHGIAKEWWILGTRTDSVQRVEVRAVRSTGARVVYGAFNATAQPEVPASIERVVPPTVTPELLEVVPRPALRVFDRYMNPVPGHPIVFTVVAGGGSALDTVITDATGTARASWVPGPYVPSDSVARLRMRPAAPYEPTLRADSSREVRSNVYPVTGLTLVAMPIENDSGPANTAVTFCVGLRDSANAPVQPSRHHTPAVTWARDGLPMTSVSSVGLAGSSMCFQLLPRVGTHVYAAAIRGMTTEAAFTFTGT